MFSRLRLFGTVALVTRVERRGSEKRKKKRRVSGLVEARAEAKRGGVMQRRRGGMLRDEGRATMKLRVGK